MGLFANLPVGLAPGLGLNAYVRLQIFSISNWQLPLSRAEVHVLHRWLPWNWHRSVSRSTCSCFHGRVRRTVPKAQDHVPDLLGQMDILHFVSAWSPSMACPNHATVTRSLSRCRDWPLHSVRDVHSVLTTFSLTNPSSVS
jgi:hypothetical protein